MVDIELMKILLMEEQYPFFTTDQLEAIAELSSCMEEAMYTACMMKAKADKIKVGPIEINNDAAYWNDLSQSYYQKWETKLVGTNRSGSLTGLCVGRSDEY